MAVSEFRVPPTADRSCRCECGKKHEALSGSFRVELVTGAMHIVVSRSIGDKAAFFAFACVLLLGYNPAKIGRFTLMCPFHGNL